MTTVITIDGNKFGVPDSVTPKDLRELIGFLHTFTAVGRHYDWDTGQDLCLYSNGPVTISVSKEELVDRDEARRISKESQERYETKKAAERAATSTAS